MTWNPFGKILPKHFNPNSPGIATRPNPPSPPPSLEIREGICSKGCINSPPTYAMPTDSPKGQRENIDSEYRRLCELIIDASLFWSGVDEEKNPLLKKLRTLAAFLLEKREKQYGNK